MKKRGVSFELSANYEAHFDKLFKKIDLSQYAFYLSDNEILYFNEKIGRADNKGLFDVGRYDGVEFEGLIKDKDYYVIHARIFATPLDQKIDPDNIRHYEDFVNSPCEIAFLCADSFVELYAKDEAVVEKIASNCKTNNLQGIEYITDENDCRTGFYI